VGYKMSTDSKGAHITQ